MPLLVHIDDPDDFQIQRPVCRIRGWCTADSLEDMAGLEFRLAGCRVPHRLGRRPDVEEAYPSKPARGFLLDLDLGDHLPGVQHREFVLEAITAGERVELRFRISGEVLGRCLEAASGG